MAVLVEGLSVVIRRSAISAKYPGVWKAFVGAWQNPSFCHDDRLVRLGFSGPPDVEAFIKNIELEGLAYLDGDISIDLVVIDQDSGFVSKCSWAKFGHGNLDGDPKKRVAGCQAVDSAAGRLMLPEGWQFAGSISERFPIAPTQH